MPLISRSQFSPVHAGLTMSLAAMSCVQLGLAASIGLADRLGTDGAAWLRLVCAAAMLIVITRPWRVTFSRSTLMICALLGAATAGLTLLFMAAIVRIPLGTASAIEFLGPLGVAVVQGRGAGRWWAVVAAAGVTALTEPWQGTIDPVGVLLALGAGACWAAYILLTQRAGNKVDGLHALAVSIPVAALVATFAAGPSVIDRLDWQTWLIGLGLAALMPVVPFALELLSLRRLSAPTFGTLMSLEPAIAMIIGCFALGQIPGATGLLGIALVVAAGIGATRTGPAMPLGQDPGMSV